MDGRATHPGATGGAGLRDALSALARRKRLVATLQIVALVLLLGALAYGLRGAWSDAEPRLRHADRTDLALGTLFVAFYYLAFVVGWQSIIRTFGYRLGYRDALRAEMLSLLAKYIPGGVWTPAARVVACRRVGITDTALVLASIALEAGLSAIAGVLVFIASLPVAGVSGAYLAPLILFAAILVVLLHPRVFAPATAFLVRPFGAPPPPSLAFRISLGLVAYYCFTWLIGGTALYFMLNAVGGDVGVETIPYLGGTSAVGAILAVVVVFAPSGLGVREGITYTLIHAIAPRGPALGAVVLNRLVITLVEAVLLVVAAPVGRARQVPREAPEAAPDPPPATPS